MASLFDATAVPDAYRRHLAGPIFTPWAAVLLDVAQVGAGESVLDVATGTGVVAAAAAERVGATGRVLATDISPAMLAIAGQAHPRVEVTLTPAEELAVDEAAFDVALSQQGFQFVTDQVAAAAAMRRALRDGGRVAVAVWSGERLLEPFDVYGQALEAIGVPEPFPNAYGRRYTMTPETMSEVLVNGGFEQVETTTRSLDLAFPSLDEAVRGLAGTPYGPAAAALDADQAARLDGELRSRLRTPFTMAAVLGVGYRR